MKSNAIEILLLRISNVKNYLESNPTRKPEVSSQYRLMESPISNPSIFSAECSIDLAYFIPNEAKKMEKVYFWCIVTIFAKTFSQRAEITKCNFEGNQIATNENLTFQALSQEASKGCAFPPFPPVIF